MKIIPLEILIDSEIELVGNRDIIIMEPTKDAKTYWIHPKDDVGYLDVSIDVSRERREEGEKEYQITKIHAYHGHVSIVVEDIEKNETVFFIVYTKEFYDKEIEQLTREKFPELREWQAELPREMIKRMKP